MVPVVPNEDVQNGVQTRATDVRAGRDVEQVRDAGFRLLPVYVRAHRGCNDYAAHQNAYASRDDEERINGTSCQLSQ